ncbi:MAG: hypothetical protein Q9187_001002 [Circinaria calcarea]
MDQTNAHLQGGRSSGLANRMNAPLGGRWLGGAPDLHQRIGRLEATVEMVERERDEARAEVEKLRGRVAELEEAVGRRDTTIRLQSQQIQKGPPNPTPRRLETPHRPTVALPNVYQRPPPLYNAPTLAAPPLPSSNQQQTSTNTTVAPTQTNRGPAVPLNPKATYNPPTAIQVRAANPSANSAPVVPPAASVSWSQQHFSLNEGTMVVQGGNPTEIDFTRDLAQLFKLVEDFCWKNASRPNPILDNDLPDHLSASFGKLSHPSIFPTILGSSSTRHFLLARHVNTALTEWVFRLHVIRGFDAVLEEAIKENRKHLQPGMPVYARAAYQQLIAEAVTKMKMQPRFSGWLKQQADTMTTRIYEEIRPLLTPGVDMASNDLNCIFQEAFKLSVDMHTQNRYYAFEFIVAGPKSFFNPSSMVNRDPAVREDPLTIRNSEYRVRLCISPVVTMTDLVGNTIVPTVIHFAEVLLCQ